MIKGLVSVLCLSMNHEKYVGQCVSSIVNQSYRNIEILYADNNSRDKSFEIADQAFGKSGMSYKGFKRSESYGISQNLNFLLKQARGEYLAYISADDWWEPSHIEKKLLLFSIDPSYGMIYGNGYSYNDKTGEELLFFEKEQPSGNLFNYLLTGNKIPALSVFIRMDVMNTVGFFDEDSPVEDWELWLRIAEKYKIGYVSTPAFHYRVGESNISNNLAYMNKGFAYVFKKYADYPEIKEAKRNIAMGQAYQLASRAPGWKSLFYILRRFQFNKQYVKHIVRCIAGMFGVRIPKSQ